MSTIMFMAQGVNGASGFILEYNPIQGLFYVAAFLVFILGAAISGTLLLNYEGDYLPNISFILTLILSVSLVVFGVTKEPGKPLSENIASKVELKYDVKVSNASDFNIRTLDSDSDISRKIRFSTANGFDYRDGLLSIRAKSENTYQIVLLVSEKDANKNDMVEYDPQDGNENESTNKSEKLEEEK